jgi:hypothetical protein
MRFLFTPRTLLLTKFLVAIACLHPIGSVAQTEPPRPSSSPSLVPEEAPTLEEVVVTDKAEAKATPKKSRHTRLTAKSKAAAKRQVEKAGRGYPNLVDNMNAAKKQRARGARRCDEGAH